jgi:cob(I)alamin adenosyltransferase
VPQGVWVRLPLSAPISILNLFMKIYTKKGDSGKTSIIGASDLNKHNIKIEAYGTVDELNSLVGFSNLFSILSIKISSSLMLFEVILNGSSTSDFSVHQNELVFIQDTLFKIGSILASASDVEDPFSITSNNIKELEIFIDNIENKLEKLTSFILPGGNIWNGYTHLARSVCRRAERRITALNMEEKIDNNILIFINRLSDYFFVLARKINVINNVDEIKWNS